MNEYQMKRKLRAFLKKHNPKCQNCEKEFAKPHQRVEILQYVYDRMEIHRIIPGKDGGEYKPGNVEALCGHCHYEAHMEEFTHGEFFIPRITAILRSMLKEQGQGEIA